MDIQHLIELTQELVNARGPAGQEDDVRVIVRRELELVCDEVWIDSADNLVGFIKGRSEPIINRVKPRHAVEGDPNPAAIKVMAHMDEIALVVKRIESDGTLRVRPLGGLCPWNCGLGPVEIMGDEKLLLGVLSVGPGHVTEETPESWSAEVFGGNKALTWQQVRVFTRLTPTQLAAAGVHPGTRVVIAQSRRKLLQIGDCLAGYFLDNRVCITIMLAAAKELQAATKRPAQDVYFVATCQEEIAGGSAAHAARTLPGATTLALDVGPVAQEYGTKLTNTPIVVYRDAAGVYTRAVCDQMVKLGRKLKLHPQTAHFQNFASDSSCAKQCGNTPRSGLLCIPTDNTHGFEIIPEGAIIPCVRLLTEFLKHPC